VQFAPQVREHAIEAVLTPMLLERMFQQVAAARAEPLLLQRHASQWLDEICARCAEGHFEHGNQARVHVRGKLGRGREGGNRRHLQTLPTCTCLIVFPGVDHALCLVCAGADALFAHAGALSRRHADLEASPVLAATHRRLAFAAMLDEMIAQMLGLVATGSEPGAVPLSPIETDDEDDQRT
jgi:hypothetical protein